MADVCRVTEHAPACAHRAAGPGRLHRHPVPYHFFRRFARVAHLHRFVQHDGPVSIARAFVTADWERLLAAAGIARDAVDVRWRVPFWLTVQRLKAS